jgi:hypothetical protein
MQLFIVKTDGTYENRVLYLNTTLACSPIKCVYYTCLRSPFLHNLRLWLQYCADSNIYWVERKVFAFSKRWRKLTKKFLQGRNWKACDTLGDGNSKQWKLYNWLNIVNIFKNDWLFIWKKTQNLSVQPNNSLMWSSIKAAFTKSFMWIEKKKFYYRGPQADQEPSLHKPGRACTDDGQTDRNAFFAIKSRKRNVSSWKCELQLNFTLFKA